MGRDFQQEARLAQVARKEILYESIDGHWVARAVALELLPALTAGPPAASSAAYLDVADACQVHWDDQGPSA